ncbi:MAG TPA: cob(I)yrinic acid a,c-diamide adenosyltransferase [Bdellovibrionota bacterium]|jgi:cob(I)alamin adenosyltransferase
MKIYTRTGDKGQTSLFGGERVSKSNGRVAAYGTFDELNSHLGLCVALCRKEKQFAEETRWLIGVQRDLFALGSWLASKEASEKAAKGEEAFEGARKNRTHVDDSRIKEIEDQIDNWDKHLTPMKSFVLPGGAPLGAQVHIARTVCRRAEREAIALSESGETVPSLVVQYLNRLADALFVLARYCNHRLGVHEDPWT